MPKQDYSADVSESHKRANTPKFVLLGSSFAECSHHDEDKVSQGRPLVALWSPQSQSQSQEQLKKNKKKLKKSTENFSASTKLRKASFQCAGFEVKTGQLRMKFKRDVTNVKTACSLVLTKHIHEIILQAMENNRQARYDQRVFRFWARHDPFTKAKRILQTEPEESGKYHPAFVTRKIARILLHVARTSRYKRPQQATNNWSYRKPISSLEFEYSIAIMQYSASNGVSWLSRLWNTNPHRAQHLLFVN